MLNGKSGVAASSSIVKVADPEDSQPNEGIQGRNRQLPPNLNTIKQPRFDRIASNSSRLGPQLARRGSWNRKTLASRSRKETTDDESSGNVTSSPHPVTPAPQPSNLSALVPRYRSFSPKLPPEPIRRRTPQDAPRHHYQPADQQPPLCPSFLWPLPGRKRKAREGSSELPPAQKLKISHHDPIVKPEAISPEPIVTSRRLVNESCSFWPTPDNCQKSGADYLENRKEFARAKSQELVRLGLKTTKAFFRADGLVIEWRSEIPVWNDTLLPERPRSSPCDLAVATLKRKRDIVEVIDVDALPPESLLSKKSRPADPESSVRKQSDLLPKNVSWLLPIALPWSSKDEIRKLGRTVEAATLKQPPPPSSMTAAASPPPKWVPASMPPSGTPISSPSKRPPLPTRLTLSGRKVLSAPYSNIASLSPGRHKKPVVVADSTTHALGIAVPASSNSSEEPTLQRLCNDGIVILSHQSTALSTNGVDTLPPVRNDMELPGDTSSSTAGALLAEWQQAGAQPAEQHVAKDVKNDEASLSDVESQAIHKLCTEDASLDLPEYEMAKDFLRQFINLFDTDRSELEMAYSTDACLSCRVPDLRPDQSARTPSSESTLHLGRTEIMDKLNSLIGYYFLTVGLPGKPILYDIAVLSQGLMNSRSRANSIDTDAVGGILATLHSQIVRSSSGVDHAMTIQQSFVLRRRTESDGIGSNESRSKDTEWPLIAVSHHMVLRDEPLLPPDQVDRCPVLLIADQS